MRNELLTVFFYIFTEHLSRIIEKSNRPRTQTHAHIGTHTYIYTEAHTHTYTQNAHNWHTHIQIQTQAHTQSWHTHTYTIHNTKSLLVLRSAEDEATLWLWWVELC